jgi:DNA-binding CsgD family transcriptional regulator
MDRAESSKPLTKRERTLVAQLLAGQSNKAIAEALGISTQTVRNQLTALFRKVGVSSRLELAAKLARPPTRDPEPPEV